MRPWTPAQMPLNQARTSLQGLGQNAIHLATSVVDLRQWLCLFWIFPQGGANSPYFANAQLALQRSCGFKLVPIFFIPLTKTLTTQITQQKNLQNCNNKNKKQHQLYLNTQVLSVSFFVVVATKFEGLCPHFEGIQYLWSVLDPFWQDRTSVRQPLMPQCSIITYTLTQQVHMLISLWLWESKGWEESDSESSCAAASARQL